VLPSQPYAAARTFDTVRAWTSLARRWNGERVRVARRDIWLTSDGQRWAVRARHGAVDGRELHREFTREYEARAMADRLIAAASGRWTDITRLVGKTLTSAAGGPAAATARRPANGGR
jgi:hypothetical protein